MSAIEVFGNFENFNMTNFNDGWKLTRFIDPTKYKTNSKIIT